MSQTEVVRLTKCVHGLVDAPPRWRARVVRDLANIRWTPMVLEPCAMVLHDKSAQNASDLRTWTIFSLRDDLVTKCGSKSSKQSGTSTSGLTDKLERWNSVGLWRDTTLTCLSP